MAIILDHVSHVYMPNSSNETRALHDISLTIEKGEFLGVIGHTGSGKSTLMQHMIGLMQPSAGTVSVEGHDLADRKQRIAARGLVGMVFQYPEYQLFEETVAKDVAFGPKNMGIDEKEIEGRVHESLQLVGLAPEMFSEKSPFDLSGGEKRRAAIAGVIAMHPHYLLLDEPMAGLDPRGRQGVINMLHSLRERTGCAIVMISHSMDDVARNAERILVLKNGEMVDCDTPENIFKNAERLIEMGLDVPQSAKLCVELRKRGVPVPADVYREEDIKKYLLEARP
ncbi:energy-coupling factor transporter ATPase [Christensenellaceae bacterium OttesenSCG-928-M15]|nr:energy-coupling factor transporter ATPase [Christensenellaceae bacterium OttesenSCG-928-M15]